DQDRPEGGRPRRPGAARGHGPRRGQRGAPIGAGARAVEDGGRDRTGRARLARPVMLEILRIDETKAGPPPEPAYFTGRVRMQNLAAAGGAGKLELLAVHFDAGAHTRPHTHPSEQILTFVRSSGFVW